MAGLTACAMGVTNEGGGVAGANGGAGGILTGAGGHDPSAAGQGGSGGEGEGLGGEGGAGGEGGEGGQPPGCVYDSPNLCATAEALGSLAGDENAPAKTASGTTSKWFKIHITEEVSSIFEEDLSYTVTLGSPANMDFDLFVHQGPQDGNPDCQATAKKGTASGNDETVSASWDDDQGFGGEDDSLWLSIEVRYISGMECDAAATWNLSIKGHT
jgi:hypothetical protein